MITLLNTFHNTLARTRLTRADLERIAGTHPAYWTEAERRTVARLRRQLCGIAGCTCGGTFGERER